MSVDHSVPVPIHEGDALFLSVKAGMTVIVKHLPEIGQTDQPESWWILVTTETAMTGASMQKQKANVDCLQG